MAADAAAGQKTPPPAADGAQEEGECGMRGSYFRKAGLHLEEDQMYQGAGLLPFREITNGVYEVLLCLTSTGLKAFSGPRHSSDAHALDTATRRFTEEVAAVLSPGALHDVKKSLDRCGALWMRRHRHVLFPLNVSNLALHHIREVVDMPNMFAKVPPRRSEVTESIGAQWVALSCVLIPASARQLRFHEHAGILREDPAFQDWSRNPSRPEESSHGELVGPTAKPKPPPGSSPQRGYSGQGEAEGGAGSPKGDTTPLLTNLRISGLPREWTDTELANLCEQFGQLKRCCVWLDPATKVSKGFGFAEFETQESAASAKQGLEGQTLPGGMTPVSAAFNYPKGHPGRPQSGKGKGKGKGKGGMKGGVPFGTFIPPGQMR
eukprot:TRINITY_DN8167_c0_g2_i1.p1 TRINITY_DN8167_c0_g2~~TRINITY_DN8167_c0_g2_i1.p1  ORF type:complete len:378 (+),score=104.75 TRINITY_DN8167_c0_g2_i1:132-1265(+)